MAKRRRNHRWSIALCASVGAHAALTAWVADRYVMDHASIVVPGFNRIALALAASQVNDADVLGDSHGTGLATDASPGELPMEAQKAEEEQSFLSRDPQGPGAVGAKPSQSTQPPGENGQNGSQQAQQTFGVSEQQASKASPKFAAHPPRQSKSDTKLAKATPPPPSPNPTPNQPPTQPPTQTATQTPTQVATKTPPQTPGPGPGANPSPSQPPDPSRTQTAKSEPAQTPPQTAAAIPDSNQPPSRPADASAAAQPSVMASIAGTPGQQAPPADPAPQADTESDPFSTKGSLEFRPGSTVVRMGRKHRITRPHLPWDSQYDFFGMTRSVLVLDLQLDQTGKVIGVTIARSSGSDGVDQACRLAAYEWWFEPAKDATGQSIRDEITFTIKFL